MNRPLLTTLTTVLLFLAPLSSLAWTGKVVNVSDGDTITVLRGTLGPQSLNKELVRMRRSSFCLICPGSCN